MRTFRTSMAACIAAGLYLGAAYAAARQTGTQLDSPPLMVEIAEWDIGRPADDTIIRSRPVWIDMSQLTEFEPGANQVLFLNLFDDVAAAAIVERIEVRSPQSFTLFGRLEDQPRSSFILVTEQEVIVANIRSPQDGTYQIRYLGNGVHVVHEIDQSAYPACGVTDEHEVEPQGDPTGDGGPCDDDGATIDVLVVYTPAARSAAGGAAAMTALINLAVAETNAAFRDSQIAPRVRLVNQSEINYAESGDFQTDLNRLTDPDDGHMDDAHCLRETYAADAVSLFVANTQWCGMAWVMTQPSPGFEAWAFNVVSTSCATGYYSFGHELGHNMGCAHDRGNAGVGGAYDYSYGHRFWGASGSQWRTIMAYSPGTRIQHFSNPDVDFDGRPTGVPDNRNDSADNALTIDNTAYTVANFRVSVEQAGNTLRASAASDGTEANDASSFPAVSADGRFVAFRSPATNLVANDTNNELDIFVHDRQTGQTTRMSVDSAGNQGSGASFAAALAGDGRYVAFASDSALVAGDTNGKQDVYIRDRDPDQNGTYDEGNGITVRVSVSSSGAQGLNNSSSPSFAGDERYLVFWSAAHNLVPNDNNGRNDIFVRDRDPDENGIYDEGNGTTVRVNLGASRAEANQHSFAGKLSADARHVAFASYANNLVTNDSNNRADVFVRDRDPDGNGIFDEGNGVTTRVSIDSAGNQSNDDSGMNGDVSISADGRFVAFTSYAANLVADDTNDSPDVFVRDRDPDGNGVYDEGNGVTWRVSVDSNGRQGNPGRYPYWGSGGPRLTPDGKYVAFASHADNLVADDTNNAEDIFLHDLQSGETTRISTGCDGQADNASSSPAVSADARVIAFHSAARNLIANDTNRTGDIYVRDRGDCSLAGEVGDMNCDGRINAFDIEPFLLALFDPNAYQALYPDCDMMNADTNFDGAIDAFDIEPFLELLFP